MDALHEVFEGITNKSTVELVIALFPILMVLLILFQRLTGRGKITVKAHCIHHRQDSKTTEALLRKLGAPKKPHEEGSMIPCKGLVVSNVKRPSDFDNELCSGKFLALHRATHDSKLDKSGDYQYGEYFRGKKRLWEARVQFQFKVPPKPSELFFGIELERYVPMTKPTKSAMGVIVSLLKKVVGDNIYHTPGDDPAVVSGDLELPAFVMPLFAFDQYIVTPRGMIPPELSDPNIPSMGSRRLGRVNEYKKEINNLTIVPGATYTFCFWGISQYLDKINWTVRLPLANLDFNLFCGQPPVHVVIYTLKKQEGGERRHLRHLKNFYFDLAFWSSQCRPWDRIQRLLGDWAKSAGIDVSQDDDSHANFSDKLSRTTEAKTSSASIFACCTSR